MEKITTIKESTAWAKNQSVLNGLGEKDGELTYNGESISSKLKIKSVLCANDFGHGVIMTDSTRNSNIDFYVFDNDETFLTDENGARIDFSAVVVVDIGIIYDNAEYRLSQLAHGEALLVNSDSIPVVFSCPQQDSSQGALNVARIINATSGAFFQDPDTAEGFNIYYLS